MKIDDREDPEFFKALDEEGVIYTKKRMEIGDIYVGKYVIERKKYTDELATIFDGRNEQIPRLVDAAESNGEVVPILLIEGFKELWEKRRLVVDNLAKLFKIGINIMMTNSSYETAEFLKQLDDDDSEIDLIGKKRKGPPFEVLLRSVPNLGRKRANALIIKHKDFWSFVDYIRYSTLLSPDERKVKDYLDSAVEKQSYTKSERITKFALTNNTAAVRSFDNSAIIASFDTREAAVEYKQTNKLKCRIIKIKV